MQGVESTRRAAKSTAPTGRNRNDLKERSHEVQGCVWFAAVDVDDGVDALGS
jgi:hypothetical protein